MLSDQLACSNDCYANAKKLGFTRKYIVHLYKATNPASIFAHGCVLPFFSKLEVHSCKILPRFKVAAISATTVFPDIKRQQDECAEVQAIKSVLNDESHARYAAKALHYIMIDGILHHYSATMDPKTEKRWLQVFVPKILRNKVFDMHHKSPLGSHFGATSTASKILQNYFWPGIVNQVRKAVSECNVCTRTRKAKPKVAFVSPPVPSFGVRWDVDFVGPFPRSTDNRRYLLCFCEASTGYPEAFATTNNDAESFANRRFSVTISLRVMERRNN